MNVTSLSFHPQLFLKLQAVAIRPHRPLHRPLRAMAHAENGRTLSMWLDRWLPNVSYNHAKKIRDELCLRRIRCMRIGARTKERNFWLSTVKMFTEDVKNGEMTAEEKREILVAELNLPEEEELAPAPKAKRSPAQAPKAKRPRVEEQTQEDQPDELKETDAEVCQPVQLGVDVETVNLMSEFAAEARFLDNVIDCTAVEAKHAASPLAVAFREVGQLMMEDTADMQRLAKLRNFIERNALVLLDAVDDRLNNAKVAAEDDADAEDGAEVEPEDGAENVAEGGAENDADDEDTADDDATPRTRCLLAVLCFFLFLIVSMFLDSPRQDDL